MIQRTVVDVRGSSHTPSQTRQTAEELVQRIRTAVKNKKFDQAADCIVRYPELCAVEGLRILLGSQSIEAYNAVKTIEIRTAQNRTLTEKFYEDKEVVVARREYAEVVFRQAILANSQEVAKGILDTYITDNEEERSFCRTLIKDAIEEKNSAAVLIYIIIREFEMNGELDNKASPLLTGDIYDLLKRAAIDEFNAGFGRMQAPEQIEFMRYIGKGRKIFVELIDIEVAAKATVGYIDQVITLQRLIDLKETQGEKSEGETQKLARAKDMQKPRVELCLAEITDDGQAQRNNSEITKAAVAVIALNSDDLKLQINGYKYLLSLLGTKFKLEELEDEMQDYGLNTSLKQTGKMLLEKISGEQRKELRSLMIQKKVISGLKLEIDEIKKNLKTEHGKFYAKCTIGAFATTVVIATLIVVGVAPITELTLLSVVLPYVATIIGVQEIQIGLGQNEKS